MTEKKSIVVIHISHTIYIIGTPIQPTSTQHPPPKKKRHCENILNKIKEKKRKLCTYIQYIAIPLYVHVFVLLNYLFALYQ